MRPYFTYCTENVGFTAIADLVEFCRQEHVQLTIVGPEAPLAAGVVDAVTEAGLKIFGPTRAAAQLESSKDFAKSFMLRHGIPTARHATFERVDQAKAHVDQQGAPIVIKADGLAAGKGVVVAANRREAIDAINEMAKGIPAKWIEENAAIADGLFTPSVDLFRAEGRPAPDRG